MKIIFLTQLLPFPNNSGAKIISFNLIKSLAKNNEIFFYSFVNNKNDLKNRFLLEKFCKRSYIEYRPVVFENYPIELIFSLFKSMIIDKSYLEYKYYSFTMKQKIEEEISNNNIQIIFVNHDSMFQYVPSGFDGKIIYNAVDITSNLYLQFTKYEINPIKKFLYKIEESKLKLLEKKIFLKSDLIYTVSKQDKNDINNLGVSSKKVHLLPIKFTARNYFKKNKNPTLLFIGLMTWKPNKDGIKWFINEIYPYVLSKIPNCKLILAGYGMKKNYDFKQKYKNLINIITDLKQNDKISSNLYKNCSAFIVPIRFGSGIRIKLLDALAHGIPVVSTTIGVRGIISNRNNGVVIGNDYRTFGDAICKIIEDKQLAINLSKQGLKFIQRFYNDKSQTKALNLINLL